MKLATPIGELYSCCSTPAEAVKCYRNTGFRYLDYSFYTVLQRENSPYLEESDRFWKAEVMETARAAQECSFTFVQAHTPAYNPLGNFDHARCMRAVHRSVEACGLLQIPNAVIHTSYSPRHRYKRDQHAYFEYNREFLSPLLETAEKYGVTLCFENSTSGNMKDLYFPRSAAEMNEFAAFMGNHPLLKCCWDTGHALMENLDQYAELTALKENLRAVHIHDNNGSADLHLAPFCGKLHLDSILRALADMKFQGCFTFEADNFMNSSRQENTPLKQLPAELRIEGLSLLYKIGKFALTAYGLFEE